MTLRSEIKKAITNNSKRYSARKVEEIEFEESGYPEERRGYLTIVVAVKKKKRKKVNSFVIPEETIWQELERFIDSISDEIRSDDQDRSSIDFWLFKIRRRINILKKALDEKPQPNRKQ